LSGAMAPLSSTNWPPSSQMKTRHAKLSQYAGRRRRRVVSAWVL
jgi:hypothetical protein